MDQFKLKSIDELDLEFVSKTRGQSPVAKQAPAPAPAPAPVNQQNPIEPDYGFFAPVQTPHAEPTYSPQPEIKEKKPRPLVPIGQSGTSYAPVGAPVQQENAPFVPQINYGEEPEVEEAPAKKSKGALVGKIISIILLVATVIVFVLGCFVSIFLDNNGSNIGGTCFNTMSADINTSNGESIVSKGDLIISKKVDISEYVVSDLIAVPSETTAGCDIYQIQSINPIGYDSVELVTVDITNPNQRQVNINSADTYGVVKSYLPVIGGLLSFAIENAILVCILFVLLAAFWCLLLVLLEKSSTPSTKEKAPKNKK